MERGVDRDSTHVHDPFLVSPLSGTLELFLHSRNCQEAQIGKNSLSADFLCYFCQLSYLVLAT